MRTRVLCRNAGGMASAAHDRRVTEHRLPVGNSAMPQIIGIDHINLAVSDLARSQAFYDVVPNRRCA
jgi:catechol-2,3-dioxygenase